MEKILGNTVKKMKEKSILVIGDMMLDRFSYGSVDRISPESPVPVLKIEKETRMMGGAGNVVSNLASLGVSCKIIGTIGSDEAGDTIKKILTDMDVSSDTLITLDDRATITKTRFISGHQHMLRVDTEDTSPLSEAQYTKIINQIDAAIGACDAVILSDYGKGVLSDAVLQHAIKAANTKGIAVIVDPKGADYSRYKGATAVTPNKKELREATNGMAVSTDTEVTTAALSLIKTHDIKNVFATRSADGISVITQNGQATHIPTKPLEVFDVAGAGDTVIAVIAAALATGASCEDAATLANLAGSIVVTRVGTSSITSDELSDSITADIKSTASDLAHIAPVCNRDKAREIVKNWQDQGYKVGLTNGCFDILHYGHVTYLAEARKQCDKLIVALNTDDSVKKLKGPLRPVNDENTRGQVMAALSSVDLVTFFGSDARDFDTTGTAVTQHIKPDFYFKGGDYKIEDVPEAQAVLAYGGEAVIMSLYEGYSTTNALDRYVEGLERHEKPDSKSKAS